MRRFLTFGLILVWAGSISAQTFNKTFLDKNEPFYFQTVSIIDTTIITAGFGIDSLNLNKPKYIWKKLNPKGEILKSYTFKDSLNGFNGTQNGLHISDSTIYHCLFSSGDGYFSRPIILKTNFKGEVIDKKFYSKTSKTVHSPLGFFISSSNHLYIYGLHQPFGNESNAMVIKVDKDLNQIWFRDYGVSNKTETAHSITELPNGNLLIGAHRTDPGMTVAGQRYKEQTWIFEIDTAGNMVREFLDTNTRTGPAKGLTQTNDGGFVYCGNYQTYWNGVFQYDHKPSLSKVDGNLTNKEWETIFNDTLGGDQSFESIKTNDGVNLIVCGNGFSEYPNSFGVLNTGTISKIDQNGNVLWLNHFSSLVDSSNLDHGFFYDVALTNNSIISCGKTEGLSGPTEGWLVKLNSNGCFDNGNCGFNSLEVKSNFIEPQGLSIYPNPFNNEFNLDFQNLQIESIEIFNYLGNLIYSSKRVKAKVDMSGFPSGVYFIKLNTANGHPIIKKAIKK